MSAPATNERPPSPGDLPGSREARPASGWPRPSLTTPAVVPPPPPVGRPSVAVETRADLPGLPDITKREASSHAGESAADASAPRSETPPLASDLVETFLKIEDTWSAPSPSFPGEIRPRPLWALQEGAPPPVSLNPSLVLHRLGEVPSALCPPSAPSAPSRRRRSARPTRPTRPILPRRAMRLLTLERDPAPAKQTSRGPRPVSSAQKPPEARPAAASGGLGLQEWMATILKDRKSLELDTTNICMVLHALWKKHATCRGSILYNKAFRRKAFNEFIMDVLKAFQQREGSEERDQPISPVNHVTSKKRKQQDDEEAMAEYKLAADSANLADPPDPLDPADPGNPAGLADPSDPPWEPTSAELSGDDPDWRESSPEPPTKKTKTAGAKSAKVKATRLKSGGLKSERLKDIGSKNAGLKTAGLKTADSKTAGSRTSGLKTPDSKSASSKTPDSETADSRTAGSRGRSQLDRWLKPRRRYRRKREERSEDDPEKGLVAVANAKSYAVKVVPKEESVPGMEDLCARVSGPMMRISGRKAWRDLTVFNVAKKDEDPSGVPDTAFLFLRCVRCPELVFVDYPSLRQHWEENCHFLSCILCDIIFNSSRLALAHLRVTHKDPVPEGWYRLVRCQPCSRAGFHSTEQVIAHMASHRQERARNPATFPPFLTCYKRIRCNQCGAKQRNHRSELEDRYKMDDPPPLCKHDPEKPPPLTCPACRRVWAGPAALAAHFRISKGMCKKAVQPLSVSVTRTFRGVDCAFCPVCHSAMNPGELLSDHLMTHLAPGLRCVQCRLVVASHEEMRAHWEFTWRCDCAACDTQVGRGMRLLQHIVEDHDGGRQLTRTARARPIRNKYDHGVCPVCGKFAKRLKAHVAESHSMRFCPCCNKEVKLVTYRNHMSKMRNIDRLRCKVCSREMSSGWALKTHMRLHTGERPYACHLCDAAYAQRVVLKTHMKAVHGLILPAAGAAAPAAAAEEVVTTENTEVMFEGLD